MNPCHSGPTAGFSAWHRALRALRTGRNVVLAMLTVMALAGLQAPAMTAAQTTVAAVLTRAEISHDDGAS